jgi:hypothetical protein
MQGIFSAIQVEIFYHLVCDLDIHNYNLACFVRG